MAFTQANLLLMAPGGSSQPNVWSYFAGADSLATLAAIGYFNAMANSIRSGDVIDISTSTTGLSFQGTFINTAGVITIAWDNTYYFNGQIANISGGASDTWLPALPAGIITKVSGVQANAITVATSNITFLYGATAVTGAALAVTTGGAAGTMYNATATANNVSDGVTALKVHCDGASTTACVFYFQVKIICGTQQ